MLKEFLKDNLNIEGSKFSLAVKNFKSEESCHINSEAKVPSASIIKLFIMAQAFNMHKKAIINLHTKVRIKPTEKVPYSIVYLLDSVEEYSIRDLITLMIIQSDNTATNVLIDFLGIDNINEFIKEKKFQNTVLGRKMLDFEAAKKGKDNYTSAEDVFLFFDKLYKHELIGEEEDKSMIAILKHQFDSSIMRMNIPDDLEIAHKSGDLSCLKHDAGIVYSEKAGDYIFVMFTYEALSDVYARNLIGQASKDVYSYFISKN